MRPKREAAAIAPTAEMMNRHRKAVMIAAILTVVLATAAAFVIGLREPAEKALLKIMEDRVDLQIRDVRYTEVGDSGIRWEITAESARYLKQENLALFERLTARLVLPDGRAFVLNGDRGRLDTESRNMEISGNVGIVSDSGDRFRTDRLRYNNDLRQLETDRPVAIENNNVRLSGVGMVYRLDEGRLTLLSQIKAGSAPKSQGK